MEDNNTATPIICKEECQRSYAIKLVKYGVRAPIVEILTDVPSGLSNQLWREIHARPSPPGRFPDSVANCLTNLALAAEAAAFVSIYNATDRRNTKYANAPDLIKAITVMRYALPNARIDSNVLYYAIRDTRSGLVRYRHCTHCNSSFIQCPSKKHTRNCPFCASMDASH